MKITEKILIGGQALVELGSSRSTSDVDYLVNDTTTKDAFIISEKVDLLNANGNAFFAEIFNKEKGNTIACPQSLLELKAYAFVQHCQNFNWQKVDDCEYDMKFLCRKFNLISVNIVSRYVTEGELFEINKIINSVK